LKIGWRMCEIGRRTRKFERGRAKRLSGRVNSSAGGGNNLTDNEKRKSPAISRKAFCQFDLN
jgi:hypothetical protein